MPYRKTDQGWFWGSKGPFDTKAKAMQVARAAYASGYHEEKRDKNLCVALDYHNTYSADPKFWDTFIYMCWMRKWDVYCITHHTGEKQNQKLMDSIGKILPKEYILFTMGKAKQDYVDSIGLEIDIWIDNNPVHILHTPGQEPDGVTVQ
jgi:hypothetical protein